MVYTVKPGTYHFSNTYNTNVEDITKSDGIKIWPNPVSTVLNVSSDEDIMGIHVVATSGAIISKYPAETTTIDVSYLPKGLYLINIATSSGSHFKKFIKN